MVHTRCVKMAVDPKSRETRQRLEKCWTLELNWDLIPETLRKVWIFAYVGSYKLSTACFGEL